jgi:arylsulfatase A-like enzyme
MPLNEYEPGTAFPGVIGRTTEESSPAWPRPLRADAGSPNVLFIVLDDVGYGQLGCYGSPIATPNLDALAAGGLLYSNMHTTALCSPSRSCIITGRNHHANATAAINELATGYPGYNGQIPFENGFLSEMLQQRGYSTYMVGKYHLMPSEFESAAGPFDRWPLGRGFERFYGFLGGDTSQWHPDLVYDNHQVEPPRTPEQGYHLTEDLADKAIEFIADAKQVAPHKPFYLHFCTGAAHAPHRTTWPRSGPTGTRASSTTAGTPTGSGCSPGRRSWASCPRARSCLGMTRTSRSGSPCPRRRAGSRRG